MGEEEDDKSREFGLHKVAKNEEKWCLE